MRIRIGLLLCLFSAGPAGAAFELLPGPVPGGGTAWAWTVRDGARAGWRGGVSIGRPADVDDLGWSHAWGGASIGRLNIAAEAYGLALEDLYRETIVGIWVSSRGLGLGLRRWETAWGDGLRRSGWTLSGEFAARRGRTGIRLVAENAVPIRPDRAAPRPAMAVALSRRITPTLDATAALRRTRLGGAGVWSIRWSPVSAIKLAEEFVTPGNFTSGIELCTSRLRAGLWFTPLAAIGSRTGVSLSWSG